MKGIIRTFIFAVISLTACQHVLNAFSYLDSSQFLLVSFALAVLYILLKPILSLVGLPDKGIGYLFLSFVLTFILFYFLTMFLNGFAITKTELSNLIIFGFVLPSKELSSIQSTVFSALVVNIIYLFFNWMCTGKK